jgi:hypothetical protein
MKRYIAAVLIPCFLAQLFGCYSMQEITLTELSSEEDELLIITTDSTKYFMKKNCTAEEIIQNAGSYFVNEWNIKSDSITAINLITYNQNAGSTNPFIKKDTATINYSAIDKVMAERMETGRTILFSLGLAVLIVGLLALIPESEGTLDLPPIPDPFDY